MTEQNAKIDGRTRRALDMAIAKRQVSQDSYRAVLAGDITLQQAKAIGRQGAPATDTSKDHKDQGEGQRTSRSASAEDRTDGPPQPVSRISKDDRTPTRTPCLCGCDELVARTFSVGHDARMFRVAREHLTEGRELSDEQREYLERSGKLERVKDKITQEKRKIGVKRGDAK